MSFGRWYVSQTNNKVLLLKKKLPGFLPTSKTSSLLTYFELVSDYTVALLKIEMLKWTNQIPIFTTQRPQTARLRVDNQKGVDF